MILVTLIFYFLLVWAAFELEHSLLKALLYPIVGFVWIAVFAMLVAWSTKMECLYIPALSTLSCL